MTTRICSHLFGLLLMPAMLSPIILAQRPVNDVCPTERKYDRFKDETTLWCGPLTAEASPKLNTKNLSVTMLIKHKGEQLRTPDVISFTLLWTDTTRGALRRAHADGKTVYILADGKRTELPIKEYTDSAISDAFVIEIGTAELKREDVELISQAKTVEGRWGATEFLFTKEGLERLREFSKFLKLTSATEQ